MQQCDILVCTGTLRFQGTNQTSQNDNHQKRSIKNLKTDASLLWITVFSLCLRNILYPAWACSAFRDQFQLSFPKTFQWNSKRICRKSRSSCRILELTTLPNAWCTLRGVRFTLVGTSLCSQASTCSCLDHITCSVLQESKSEQTNLQSKVTQYAAHYLMKHQKFSLKVWYVPAIYFSLTK